MSKLTENGWDIEGAKFENAWDLITRNYSGNYPDQMSIYLKIDWYLKKIWVEAQNYQISGTPVREWFSIVTSIRLPDNIDATEIINDLDNIAESIINLEAIFDIAWNGSNYVGRFIKNDDDDEYTVDNLIYDLENCNWSVYENGGLWDARDWIDDTELYIAADMTDEELETIKLDLIEIAHADNIVLYGLSDYLIDIRDRMRACGEFD